MAIAIGLGLALRFAGYLAAASAAGALLLESGSFLLLEDGSSHLLLD
jgi:hypothetical protein